MRTLLYHIEKHAGLQSLFLLLVVLIGLQLSQAHAETAKNIDFQLNDIYNKPHKLSDYRGKWVIVNYWATWCPPCADEVPELNKFHRQHKDRDAVVLGINFEYQDLDYVKEFMQDFAISYPVLISKDMIDTPFGQLVGLPTTYLISPQGHYVDSHIGPLTAKDLEQWIAEH